MSKKSSSRSSIVTPTPQPTAMELLGAIYWNRADKNVRALFAGASEALAWAVSYNEGMFDVLTEVSERLNVAARSDVYAPSFFILETALTGSGSVDAHDALTAAVRVRSHDIEAAFAIGLAAGLRLAGAAGGGR